VEGRLITATKKIEHAKKENTFNTFLYLDWRISSNYAPYNSMYPSERNKIRWNIDHLVRGIPYRINEQKQNTSNSLGRYSHISTVAISWVKKVITKITLHLSRSTKQHCRGKIETIIFASHISIQEA
jgi:hypothetical protein